MIILKYSRKEAIKNKCYDTMALAPRKGFLIRCLLPSLVLLFLLVVISSYLHLPMLVFILLIYIILLGIPIWVGLKFTNNNNWFVTTFIKDEDNNFWYVEQSNKSYHNDKATDDEEYLKILNKYKETKKVSGKGKVIKLTDIKLQNETKKYYVCNYKNEQGLSQSIKILKAYENIKNIIKG